MNLEIGQPNWFALTVRPNHERSTERALAKQGFEAYAPVFRMRSRWSDRIKESERPLFPGYVFSRFAGPERIRVLNSPGVRSIVAMGKTPAPVDDSEIDAVRALIASGRPLLPWPYIQIGQQVVIREGPLAPLRGVLLRARNLCRVVVSVEALSCSVAIELDADLVAPQPPPRIC